MAENGESAGLPREGTPAPIVRSMGWAMLAILAAFLINNVLNVGFGLPTALSLFDEGGSTALVPWAVYIVCIGLAVLYVYRDTSTGLRWDAQKIHNFNVYVIRALFWAVLLIGCVDATIAFLR
ncbi:MAG: permease, partial [Pseudomonadota bacterium]